jgi:hypothetical protein
VDQDLSFWEEVAERFGAHVSEVYFPLPIEIVASGRSPQPTKFMETFLRRALLPKAALVNPIVLPQPVEVVAPPIVETLNRLRGDFGVSGVTVTNPALARLIKKAIPDLRVTASVLMGIATPAQVLMVRDDVDAITADSRVLRDLPGLQRLRDAFAGEIRLIVNEACLPGCPYRAQHFYEMGYGNFYPQSLCQQMLSEQPWLRLTGAWILPQHLFHYAGLYDTLKLAGRVTLRERARYIRVLHAYIHREKLLPREIGGGPASVLTDMDLPDELFATILRCEKNCHACPVCRDYVASHSNPIQQH